MMVDNTINEQKIKDIQDRCKNRMDMSFYKYGPARLNFGEGRCDAVNSAEMCIDKFNKTGNNEYLHDAINYLMFRILFPMPGEFFESTGSNDSAGVCGTPINLEKGD